MFSFIWSSFSQDEKNTDGTEKSISFGEYLEKVNSRAIKEHFEKMKALKSVDKPEKDLDWLYNNWIQLAIRLKNSNIYFQI